MTERKGGEECYVLVDGKKEDASVHEPILDNEAARRALAPDAVKLAIELGMDPDLARDIYGA